MARVVFLQDVLFEPFGPELLSAVLKADGHSCDLLVLSAEGRRRILPSLRRLCPDLLCFSISSFGFQWALEVAAEAKRELELLTVFGGPHPTYFPELAREGAVDCAVRGEGEGALLDVARALDRGAPVADIPNLVMRDGSGGIRVNPVRPLISDLDAAPFADRQLAFKYPALGRLPYKRFMVGRGCPYSCTYCFNLAARQMYRGLGRYVRHRSPANVIAEIDEVRRRWGISTVGFVDDTFTSDRRWLLAFLEQYRAEVRLPFTCLTRVNEIDEEVAAALAAAGCHYVSFGVEVGNERIRDQVLGRRMSDQEIRTSAALLRGAGIPFLTYNMFGVPGETVEDGLATIRLNAEIRASQVGTSVFQPLVGTPIYDHCRSGGFLERDLGFDELDRMTRSSPLVNIPDLQVLVNLQKLAFLGVRFPRLIPLVARLARLPLGKAYDLAYKVSLFFRYKLRFRLSTRQVIRLGLGSKGRFG